MKKLIALILILVVIPFFIISEESLNLEVNKIKLENIKNPEFKKWEYVKDRVFDENGVIEKGYDKPVIIQLGKSASYKDSLIVSDFIEELKILLPTIKIGFELPKEISFPFHYVSLGFRNDSIEYDRYLIKENYLDGNTIGKTVPGFITTSDNSKHSFLNFDLKEGTSDIKRRMSIEQELLKAVFLTKNMEDSFNNLFPVQSFHSVYNLNYGFMGKYDKFLLQKLYSDDFLEQFKAYLYANYPWRYANYFLNKKRAEIEAWAIIVLSGLLVFVLLFSFFQKRKFKYAYFNYFFPIVFFVWYLFNCIHIYSYFTNMNNTTDVKEYFFGLFFYILGASIISLGLWIAEMLERKYMRYDMNFGFQLLLKIIYTFVAFNLPHIVFFLFNGMPLNWLEFYFPMFIFTLVLAFGRGLLIYLTHYSDNLLKQKDVELSQLRALHSQAELKTLQAQINPHFLYNSLNSIASLAYISAERTEKMALSLSDLFKYAINRKGKKISTVKDEVEMVQNYLEIEQTRFGDRLEFVIDVEEAVLLEEIPMFILQPLVENAVKHGISKIEEQGKIVLQILKTNKGIEIKILDNGPDFPEGLVSGHGLQTVYDLLRLTYGEKALLKWQNTPEKSIIILIESSKD